MIASYELDAEKERSSIQGRFHRFAIAIFTFTSYTLSFLVGIVGVTNLRLFFLNYQTVFSGEIGITDSVSIFTLTILAAVSSFISLQLARVSGQKHVDNIARSKQVVSKDARAIADKLEKTMRVTVEIQDQIEINLARKLELDLRIAEAQIVLEYYYSVVEDKLRLTFLGL